MAFDCFWWLEGGKKYWLFIFSNEIQAAYVYIQEVYLYYTFDLSTLEFGFWVFQGFFFSRLLFW